MSDPVGSVLVGYSPNDFLMTNFNIADLGTCPNNATNFNSETSFDITSKVKSSITGITLMKDGIIYLCDSSGNIYSGNIDGHISIWLTKKDDFQDTADPPNSYSLPVNFTGITTNGKITALCSSTPIGPSDKTMKSGGYCYYFKESNKVLLQINGLQQWNAIAIASDNYLYAQSEHIYYSQFKDGYFGTLMQIMISDNAVVSTPNTIFTKDKDIYYINSNGSYGISHNDANVFTQGNASHDNASTNFCVNNQNVFYLMSGNIYLSGNQIQISNSPISCGYFTVNTVKDRETIVAYKYTASSGSVSANITVYKKDADYCNNINPKISTNTNLKNKLLATTYTGSKGDANYADTNKIYNFESVNRIHLGVGIAITAMSIFYLSRNTI